MTSEISQTPPSDDCCTYQCTQGRDCPVRQRAGRPADYKVWQDLIGHNEEQIREWEQRDRSDRLSLFFLLAMVAMVIAFFIGIGMQL